MLPEIEFPDDSTFKRRLRLFASSGIPVVRLVVTHFGAECEPVPRTVGQNVRVRSASSFK